MIKRISSLFLVLFFIFSIRPALAVNPTISGYSIQDTIQETNRSAIKIQVKFDITNGDVGATYYYVYSATTTSNISSIDTQNGSNYLSSTSQPNSQYPTVVLDAGGSASVVSNAKINLASSTTSFSESLNNFIVTIYPVTNTSQSYTSNSISPAPTINFTSVTPTPTTTPTPTITPTRAPTATPTITPTPTEIISVTPTSIIASSTTPTPTPTPKAEDKESTTNLVPILFIIAGILLCFVPLALSRPDIFNVNRIKNIFKKKHRSVRYQESSQEHTQERPQEPPQDIPEIR